MKLSSFGQRSLHLFHLLPFLCHEVAANTEIINFSSSRARTVDLPLDVVGNWPKLHPSDNERRWTLEPAALHTPPHRVCEHDDRAVASNPPFSCPHELWLLLDLDDETWASYSTFTLRLSWPASTPAEFTITMYTPEDLLARLSDRDLISTTPGRETHARASTSASTSTSSTRRTLTTRSRYARIRAVDAGVPTPRARSYPSLWSSALALLARQSEPELEPEPGPEPRVSASILFPGSDAPGRAAPSEQGAGRVPLVVIVEPLYLGVLPATLLPAVCFLIPVVLAAALLVPFATAYVEPLVQQARADLNTTRTGTKKER